MYCSKCGAALAEGAAFCPNCGQACSVVATARAPIMGVPAAASAYAAVQRVDYGGFWLRLLAYIIDNVVIGLGIVLALVPLIFLTGLGALLSQIHPEGVGGCRAFPDHRAHFSCRDRGPCRDLAVPCADGKLRVAGHRGEESAGPGRH